jgi:hypothetical protein
MGCKSRRLQVKTGAGIVEFRKPGSKKQVKSGVTGRKKPSVYDGLVRMEGVEPTRLAALDPKSSASANFATSA